MVGVMLDAGATGPCCCLIGILPDAPVGCAAETRARIVSCRAGRTPTGEKIPAIPRRGHAQQYRERHARLGLRSLAAGRTRSGAVVRRRPFARRASGTGGLGRGARDLTARAVRRDASGTAQLGKKQRPCSGLD